MKYYIYIMFSPSCYQYYVGQSHESPEDTLDQHNSGKRAGTKKGAPWQLVFSKQFDTSCEAYILMQKLQNLKSRKFLKFIVDQLTHLENEQHENHHSIV